MHRGFQNPAAPPQQLTAPRSRVNLTADNQSLVNSIRSDALTPQETETRLQSLFNLMTNSGEEGEAQFREVVSALGESYRPSMASLLTSNSDRFLEIARCKNGSSRLQELIGKSDDADIFFFAAILCRFVDVMTDEGASHVAIKGMKDFNEVKRRAMYPQIVFHAVHLACHGRGSIALKKIISYLDDPNLGDRLYRDELLDKVASNAFSLSSDAFGNFVVQHVLELYDLPTTRKVANNLNGHFVELSRTNYGRHVVEWLLKTVESGTMVVAELLGCEEHTLRSLACSEYGSFVVGEALRVTMNRPDLFWSLVDKLWLFHRQLRMSHHGRTIAEFLDSINTLQEKKAHTDKTYRLMTTSEKFR